MPPTSPHSTPNTQPKHSNPNTPNPWLVSRSPLLLPPRVLVVGCGVMVIDHVMWLLAGSGCEVVDGGDLQAVCDPTQQLAGLPEELQQELG
jgi:hypothetical protein